MFATRSFVSDTVVKMMLIPAICIPKSHESGLVS